MAAVAVSMSPVSSMTVSVSIVSSMTVSSMTVSMTVISTMTVSVSTMSTVFVVVSSVTVSMIHTAVKQGVAVTVTSVSVRVSMSSVLEHKDSDQVDEQTGDRDRKQPLVVNVWRLQSSLDSFREDEEGCEDEEESVDEAGQNLCSDITVGEAVVGSPPGDDGGCQTCQQSGAVKEHVEGV